MAAASSGSSKLEHLRSEAHSRGLAWLRTAMDKTQREELCQLARAGGLRVRREDKAWMSVGELREALVQHFAPERSSAPEVFGREIVLGSCTHLCLQRCGCLMWFSNWFCYIGMETHYCWMIVAVHSFGYSIFRSLTSHSDFMCIDSNYDLVCFGL